MQDGGKRERGIEEGIGGVRVPAMMRRIEVKVRQRETDRQRERERTGERESSCGAERYKGGEGGG